MKTKSTEIMLDQGFFVITLDDGLTISACLDERAKPQGENHYKKQISNDGGFSWGMCGDGNEPAFEKYGSEAVWKHIVKEGRANNIKFK
jgi:hypothetical protein